MIKKGDIVTIYADPVSEKNVEGEATVVTVNSEPTGEYWGRTMYQCEVRFHDAEPGEDGTYNRFVLEPKETKP